MADFSNSFMQAADIEEIKASGNSMQDSFWDYVTHGTVSAVTSAAVGFYNTGVALGEAIGFDVDDAYADEVGVVGSVFGKETQDFYKRHKEGIDLTGFIAGSFIPGGAAIGALRAAQRAGKLTEGMKLASGMKTADIVLGSPAVKRATEAVLSRATPNLNNPAVWRAYGRGLQQQVLEAAVAETAIIATMNQSPTVNSEGLGYFEAAKNQFVEATPFVLVGGALGGGLEVFRVRGALKRAWDKEFVRTADLANPELPTTFGMAPGDQITLYSRTLQDFRLAPQFAVEKGDDFARKQKDVGEGIINRAIEDAIIEANGTGSSEALPIIQQILKGDDTGRIDFAKLDSTLSGLQLVKNFSAKEGEELFDFYSKSRSPLLAVNVTDFASGAIPEGSSLNSAFGHLYEQVKGRVNKSKEKFIEDLVKNIGPRVRENAGIAWGAADIDGVPTLSMTISDLENGLVTPAAYMNKGANQGEAGKWARGVTNAFRKELGLKAMDEAEYDQLVMLHELTHAKANTPAHIQQFWTNFEGSTKGGRKALDHKKFIAEAVELSKTKRKWAWDSVSGYVDDVTRQFGGDESAAFLAIAKRQNVEGVNTRYPANVVERAQYLFDPRELLADAGAQLAHPKFAEQAAKRAPTTAKFFNTYGGIAKSFSPVKAYYNTRTGQTLTSYLPGVNDYGRMVFSKNQLYSQSLGRGFKRSTEGFRRIFSGGKMGETFKVDHDYLDFSAQWAIAQKADLEDFKNAAGEIVLDSWDVPMLERVLKEGMPEGTVVRTRIGKNVMGDSFQGDSGLAELKDHVLDMKLQMRGHLLTDEFNQFNEHEIAHMLNIDTEAAMGIPTGEEALLLARNFEEPETYVMNYTNKLPKDSKIEAHSMQAVQERMTIQREVEQRASATVLGELGEELPSHEKVTGSLAGTLTGTESRAGFLSQVRTDFGSLREMASYIGNRVRGMHQKRNQEVVEDFAKAFRTFNATNAQEIRAELSFASNLMSRDWYLLARGTSAQGDEVTYMVRKDLADDPAFWGVKSADELPDLDDLTPEGLSIVDGARLEGKHGAVALGEEVADFMKMHRRRNAQLVQKKKAIAEAKGRQFTADDRVLYAPPRDLTKTKFFSFVIPTEFTQGADARKYMVYGTTAEELALKTAKIKEQHGGKYKVVTNQEAQQYKKLQEEYNSGLVFDEINFDQGAFRKGTSAELAPNLDLEGSYSLERFRNFHHRQEEYVINSGVELKYNELFTQLRRIDQERSKFQKSTLFAKDQPASIWEDTAKMMLDQKGTGTELEQLWVRVNDFIGEKGSEVLGNAIDIIRKTVRPGQRLTQEKLDEYNQYLSDRGYNPPFKQVSEALVASPNLQDSRIVPSLVKTLNNLTSTMMLRLDAANSILQVMSAPILLGPVLKEAKQSLRGTERYKQLEELTTTVQPHSGMREPTVMKMATTSMRRFFSAEGKEFLQELRDRGIVADYLQEYQDATDFSMLNGRHTLQTVNHKIEQLARFGGKYTGFTLSEELTRFVTADSIRQLAEVRGMSRDEMFAAAASAVDKVHGIYRNTQRVQLFQGPIGQAIGLYQTYFFNFVQNAAKWAGDTDRKKLALQAAMQSSLFGIQSFPGFQTLNHQIGMANADDDFKDIYKTLGAEEEGGLGQYLMYGLGSHALVTPIDFYSRGDMAIRNALIVPTSPQDFPSVAIISKAVSNMVNVAKQMNNGAPVGEALLHGLAHNGMNRPMQGLANIARGYTTNGRGQKYFDNTNYLDYNAANDMDWGGMFARLIGSKPLNESIYMQAYFRDKSYQANMNDKLEKISTTIQMSQNAGEASGSDYNAWARQYESIGGDPENFKGYWSRQLTKASEPQVATFRNEMNGDTELSRLQKRLNEEYSTKPIWEY